MQREKALKIEFSRQKPTQNSKKYFKKFLLKIQTFFMNFQNINVSYCRFFLIFIVGCLIFEM